jgi:hypothetical protein
MKYRGVDAKLKALDADKHCRVYNLRKCGPFYQKTHVYISERKLLASDSSLRGVSVVVTCSLLELNLHSRDL